MRTNSIDSLHNSIEDANSNIVDNLLGLEIEIPVDFLLNDSNAMELSLTDFCLGNENLSKPRVASMPSIGKARHSVDTGRGTANYCYQTIEKMDARIVPLPRCKLTDKDLFNNLKKCSKLGRSRSSTDFFVDNIPAQPKRDATLTGKEARELKEGLKNILSINSNRKNDRNACGSYKDSEISRSTSTSSTESFVDNAPAKPQRDATLTKKDLQELQFGLKNELNKIRCGGDSFNSKNTSARKNCSEIGPFTASMDGSVDTSPAKPQRSTAACSIDCFVDNTPVQPQRDVTLTKRERQELKIGIQNMMSVYDNTPLQPRREQTLTQKESIKLQADVKNEIAGMKKQACNRHEFQSPRISQSPVIPTTLRLFDLFVERKA